MLEKIYIFISEMATSFLTLLKIILRSNFKVKKIKIDSDSCIILANGPSVNKDIEDNLISLKNKSTLCVNAFSTTKYFTIIKPRYYVITGPEIWSGTAIDTENIKKRNKLIDDLIEKTDWPLSLFLPFESNKYKKFIQKIRANENINIEFFNNTPVEGLKQFNFFLFDKALGMPRPHNVLVPTLMMAIYHGFKNIYLLGVDHSWLPLISVDQNNTAMLNQKHFYDETTSKSKPMYLLGKRQRKLFEILKKFYLTFKAYVEIREYSDKKKVNIYNCTANSFIDAFERRNIDDYIESI